MTKTTETREWGNGTLVVLPKNGTPFRMSPRQRNTLSRISSGETDPTIYHNGTINALTRRGLVKQTRKDVKPTALGKTVATK